MWCNCIHQSVTLRKSILLNLFDHVGRLVREEEEEEMTSERISYWLKLTRTDFNGMWWSFFFSSFNLCRPVCCRTCHCPSLLKFHFETSNSISHRIPFCLRPRSIYVSSFFLLLILILILQSSKQLNAKKKHIYSVDLHPVPLYIDLIIPLWISILIKSY